MHNFQGIDDPAPFRYRFGPALLALGCGVVAGAALRLSLPADGNPEPFAHFPSAVEQEAASTKAGAVAKRNPVTSWREQVDSIDSVKERDEEWRREILSRAAGDLSGAIRLFYAMPGTFTSHPREMILAALLEMHGVQAFEAALNTGFRIEFVFNALRKSALTSAVPYLRRLVDRMQAEGRRLTADEMAVVMDFVGRDGISDAKAAWAIASTQIDVDKLDGETIDGISQHGNPELALLMIDTVSRPWDAARIRQASLEAMARNLGNDRGDPQVVNRLLRAEPGVSQAQRFAAATATRRALAGDERGSLEWAAGLSDPLERDAAIGGAMNYLGSISSLRPLHLVAADPGLRANADLVKVVAARARTSFTERDTRDLTALRALAAEQPEVGDFLRNLALPGLLPEGESR